MRGPRLKKVSLGVAVLSVLAAVASANADAKHKRPIVLSQIPGQLGITLPGGVQRIPGLPPQAPGPGPYPFGVSNLIYSQLVEPTTGDIVGSVHTTCVFTGINIQLQGEQGRNSQLCTYAFVLNNVGQITAQGVFDQIGFDTGSPQNLAITGGTGGFSAARGEVKVTFGAPLEIYLQ